MRWFAILFLVSGLSFFGSDVVYADPNAVTACTVVVTPESGSGDWLDFYFTITDFSTPVMDSNRLEEAVIYAPSGVEVVSAGGDPSNGDFTVFSDRVEFNFPDFSFPSGGSGTVFLSVNTGGATAMGSAFVVKAKSRLDERVELTTCPLSVDVVPEISNLSYSVQSESTVKIAWTTSESTTSTIWYGLSSGTLNQTGGDSVLTTNHEVVIPGLIVGSTYYFVAQSTDSSGNTVSTQEFFVTMPEAGQVVTETNTVTVTNVVTQTKINTNTTTNTVVQILRDTTPPKVTLTNIWEPFYSTPPLITGTATDNTRVNSLEYTIDKGRTWRPLELQKNEVGSKKNEAIGAAKVSFEFEPPLTEEGNYEIAVRVFDAEGNKGTSKFYTVVLDRLPPLFGAVHLSWGPGLMVPTSNRAITTMVGVPIKMILGAVGGATEIEVRSMKYEERIGLTQEFSSGRWVGELEFDTPGEMTISAFAIDGLLRETESDLFEVNVLPSGSIVDTAGNSLTATVIVFAKNQATGKFEVWDGKPFGQKNPSTSSGQAPGEWGLVLPAGSYYIEVRSMKYEVRRSEIFELEETGLVKADVVMEEVREIGFGKWKVRVPRWEKPFGIEIAIIQKDEERSMKNEWAGKQLPEMEFFTDEGKVMQPSDWLGQETILVLDAPWSPSASVSLTYLSSLAQQRADVRTVWVAAQSTSTVLQGIRARSESAVSQIVADRDAHLTEYFNVHRLPLVITLDRMGVVTEVRSGLR